jgi:DNA-binding GntR family transcriptional regulator
MSSRSGGLGNARLLPYLKTGPVRGKSAATVAEVVREAILDRVLEPGAWLREEDLAQELSVSRTPVREALKRLAAEGLVTITANQGAVVSPLSIEDILELYAVRETLEGLAARLAAKRISQESLDTLQAILGEMGTAAGRRDVPAMRKLNMAFHEVIQRASGNRYLDRFLTQVQQSIRRFEHTTYEVPGRPEETIKEHRRLLHALAMRDPVAAERCAVEHMHHARDLRIRMLQES